MVEYVKDFRWEKQLNVKEFVEKLGSVGFSGVEIKRACDVIVKMKMAGAKIFLSFTSNMVTSGLRGLFAQVIEKGLADVCVTTIGGIEEDIIKAKGEKFLIGSFDCDDYKNYEDGLNRVGNILISTQSYIVFENFIRPVLKGLYERKKVWTPSEIFREIGLKLDDGSSILCQAARNNVPVFCPAITDGSFGFQLYLFQQDNPDFVVDVVSDFKNILLTTDFNEQKGIIALGGSISKHHAILATLLNGGCQFAVYMTTSQEYSGSVSGATTREAKSWGKLKDSSDSVTVRGDVSVNFPLVMSYVFEVLE